MTGGLDTRPTAVTIDLEELVKQAWQGRIRIPHFQRPFRWGREDIIRLFDSVARGYPIGSVLLWIRPAPAGRVTLGDLTFEAPEFPNALWVVDGQQRITSLANALDPKAAQNPKFALGYDLRARSFVRLRSSHDPTVVPLPVLFNLPQLISWFHDRPEIGEYLGQATEAAATIRQYKVPAYQVENSDVEVLQDIFDRLNNYGKRLSKAEIFTALNAGSETDAADRLTIPLIAENINAERGFGVVDGDTVLKTILARRNPDVLRDIRNEFSGKSGIEFPGEDRDRAYEQTQIALSKAVEFVQDHASVPHVGMLPYRNLLVVLARYFAHFPEPGDQNSKLLRRWFWRAAVVGPEGFRGGTSGAIRAFNGAIRPGDQTGSLQNLLALTGAESYQLPNLHRFRANEARTKIVLCAWWHAEPRSPETGDVCDQSTLAYCLTDAWTASGAVQTIAPRRDVPDTMRQYAANRLLLPPLRTVDSEIAPILARRPDHLDDARWAAVLDSHSITAASAKLLADERHEDFLNARHELLEERLITFLKVMCEWSFEDTPALEELDLDDEDDDGFTE